MIEPLELEFEVGCPPAQAFRTWTERIDVWWPRGHSVSGDPALVVTIEGRRGGRIFERTPGGEEHEWGEVLVWEPPHRIAYLWHLRFDRADATEVDVTFVPRGDVTLVRIEHRGWERLGAAGPERRDRNASGWRGVLPRYLAACAAGG